MQLSDFYFNGTSLCVEYYQNVYDECLMRLEKKEGAAKNEKYRLLSPYYFPTYGWEVVDHLEKKWGAVNVMELFFTPWQDMDFNAVSPLEALAKKYYEHPITGFQNAPLDMLIKEIVREVREYKADAVVWWAHRSCSHMLGAMWSIDKAIQEQVDIPILKIDSDYADPFVEPVSNMIEKIDSFFEMIAT
jgi:benzoyl-CoA reductase/2-hydroxyglutaryl-CoA dehydratase subunit BcrC/BadD/HgdB